MFDPRSARQIDRRLLAQGPPLLAGGSAYACIYTGGAAETHFCACTMALDDLFRRRYPLRLFIILLFSVYSLVRVGVLLVIEFLLAFFDCGRGLIAGQDLWKELKFVPSRVGVSILMRELATIGAKIDVTRGLPVIYLDLVGYDEQAHRRGPSSRFAHWSLKGIDGAIARIGKAARRSSRRDYDVWIFSDHGSEEMVSCLRQTAQTLPETVKGIFGGTVTLSVGEHGDLGGPSERIQTPIMGRSSIRPRMIPRRERHDRAGLPKVPPRAGPHEPVIAAMGPIGHVYLDHPLNRRERDRIAKALVERARIPMVTVAEGRDHVRVWRQEGQFVLPEEAALVFAPDHPFLEEIVGDFRRLCRHPDAGDFVLWGWSRSGSSCVFSIESGSHAGPGPEETHAFALLPGHVSVRAGDKGYLRPLDLRRAALRHLGRDVSQLTLVSMPDSVKSPSPALIQSAPPDWCPDPPRIAIGRNTGLRNCRDPV